jgi:hypothetical protein
VDAGPELDALAGAAGAVVVTVTVGAADELPDDEQPATAATQANAAAATASRTSPERPLP